MKSYIRCFIVYNRKRLRCTIYIVNNKVLPIDLPAITEIDLSRLAVFGLTLPSRCPCCPGGARKTQSLVAPTLELQIEKYIIYVSFVNLYQ